MISGKLLGGTTRVNNGLYSRCPAGEFEGWGDGWKYDELKKLYDKAETKVEDTKEDTKTGEWHTRIVPPFFKSSERYPFQSLITSAYSLSSLSFSSYPLYSPFRLFLHYGQRLISDSYKSSNKRESPS